MLERERYRYHPMECIHKGESFRSLSDRNLYKTLITLTRQGEVGAAVRVPLLLLLLLLSMGEREMPRRRIRLGFDFTE